MEDTAFMKDFEETFKDNGQQQSASKEVNEEKRNANKKAKKRKTEKKDDELKSIKKKKTEDAEVKSKPKKERKVSKKEQESLDYFTMKESLKNVVHVVHVKNVREEKVDVESLVEEYQQYKSTEKNEYKKIRKFLTQYIYDEKIKAIKEKHKKDSFVDEIAEIEKLNKANCIMNRPVAEFINLYIYDKMYFDSFFDKKMYIFMYEYMFHCSSNTNKDFKNMCLILNNSCAMMMYKIASIIVKSDFNSGTFLTAIDMLSPGDQENVSIGSSWVYLDMNMWIRMYILYTYGDVWNQYDRLSSIMNMKMNKKINLVIYGMVYNYYIRFRSVLENKELPVEQVINMTPNNCKYMFDWYMFKYMNIQYMLKKNKLLDDKNVRSMAFCYAATDREDEFYNYLHNLGITVDNVNFLSICYINHLYNGLMDGPLAKMSNMMNSINNIM